MTELLVGTKKGLVVLRGPRGGVMEIATRSFPGEVVEYAIRDPRSSRISSGLLASRSSPSKTISPLTMRPPGSGTSRSSERQVIDFPDPDSPTMPRVSPRCTENVAPSTALTTPRRV